MCLAVVRRDVEQVLGRSAVGHAAIKTRASDRPCPPQQQKSSGRTAANSLTWRGQLADKMGRYLLDSRVIVSHRVARRKNVVLRVRFTSTQQTNLLRLAYEFELRCFIASSRSDSSSADAMNAERSAKPIRHHSAIALRRAPRANENPQVRSSMSTPNMGDRWRASLPSSSRASFFEKKCKQGPTNAGQQRYVFSRVARGHAWSRTRALANVCSMRPVGRAPALSELRASVSSRIRSDD